MKKTIIAIAFVALAFAIQLLPYGHNHNNPPVQQEPTWNPPETRVLAQRACFDCHSNETHWPWYSNFAPASWFVQNNVNSGRAHMNFSEWSHRPEEVEEAPTAVREFRMPPADYLALHPEARLTDSERARLVDGLRAIVGYRTASKEQ